MSWVVSEEVHSALNALAWHEERHIDGKTFRLVCDGKPEEKLFSVTNRPCGLQHLFSLADAVRFALHGELVPDPGFLDLTAPYACEDCGATRKPVWSGPVVNRCWCTPCMMELCDACRLAHGERHEADPDYRAVPKGPDDGHTQAAPCTEGQARPRGRRRAG